MPAEKIEISPVHGRWVLEGGDFELSVGGSSRDLPLIATVTVPAPALATPLTLASTIGEWLAHPAAGPVLLEAIRAMPGSALGSDPTVLRMVESLPLGHLIPMTGGRLDITGIGQFLDQANSETR